MAQKIITPDLAQLSMLWCAVHQPSGEKDFEKAWIRGELIDYFQKTFKRDAGLEIKKVPHREGGWRFFFDGDATGPREWVLDSKQFDVLLEAWNAFPKAPWMEDPEERALCRAVNELVKGAKDYEVPPAVPAPPEGRAT